MSVEQLRMHCDCPSVFETRYEPSTDASPTGAVVEALAAAANVDPIDLPPLSESVDPDALDKLFEGQNDDLDSNGMVLGFAVDGWNVFIRGDGHIRVCDPSEQAEASPLFGTTDTARMD